MKKARGDRNNNPTNIFDFGIKWNGLVTLDNVRDQPKAVQDAFWTERANNPPMCVFVSKVKGLRAAAMNLLRYQDRDGLETVRQMIHKWAPKGHGNNDPDIYAENVSAGMEIGPDEPFSFQQYRHAFPMLKGMVRVENGYDAATDDEITEALRQAGINRPASPALRDPAVAGGALATVTGVAGAARDVADAVDRLNESARPFGQVLADVAGSYGPTIAVFLAVGVIGFLVWRLALRKRKIEAA